MNPTNLSLVAGTSFLGFCSALTQDPRVSVLLMAIILLTCTATLAHILISCWISNKKARKKREVWSGRVPKADTGSR